MSEASDESGAAEGSGAGSSAPLALQIAVRVERTDPPTANQAAVAAALATIALLDDERCHPDGPWHDAVTRWNGARIRKIVRRARGSDWRRAQEVDGVTVTVDGVEARAFVPGPIDEVPRAVGRLQIQAAPLAEPSVVSAVEPAPGVPETGRRRRGLRLPGRRRDRSAGEPGRQAGELRRPGLRVAITPEVEMTWGKRAAQCAHATQRAWMTTSDERRRAWAEAGRPLTVVHPDADLWPRLVDEADVEIRDGGFTEIPAGTRTTVARWVETAPTDGSAQLAEEVVEGLPEQ